MDKMFSNCVKLSKINLESFNALNAENTSGMFESCSNLTSVQFSYGILMEVKFMI